MKRKTALTVMVFLMLLICPSAAAENLVADRNGQWTDRCSAMTGEEIRCKAFFEAEGGREYIVRSAFSPGIRFLALDSLRCSGKTINASHYTLLTGRFVPENGFEIRFCSAFSRQGSIMLEIEYRICLTEEAEEYNSCALTLAGSGESLLYPAAGITAYALKICRSVSLPDTEKQSNPLSGVCYSLYRDKELKERIAFYIKSDGTYVACAGSCCAHSRHAYLMRTGENGVIDISGLSSGKYYLLETRTPEGHRSMAEGTELVISSEGEIIAGGVTLSNGMLPLVERGIGKEKENKEKDPLDFYIHGSRVLSGLLAAMVAGRRKLFS